MDFGLTTRREGAATVVAVAGEVDAHTAPQLRAALAAAADTGVVLIVVDLTDTSFLDSSALGALVGADKQVLSEQRLVVVCPQPRLRRLFRLSRLDEVIAVVDTMADATTSS